MAMLVRSMHRFLVLVLIIGTAAYAESSADLITSVKKTIGKISYLRVPDGNRDLHYDSNGASIGAPGSCPWTACSALIAADVSIAGNALVISGNRAVAIYDRDSRSMVPLPISRKFTLSLALPSTLNTTQVLSAVSKIFDSVDMDQKLRDYWRPNGEASADACISGWLSNKVVYRFDCVGTQLPRAISAPAPDYPEIARRKGVGGGGDTLNLVVNEQGLPEVIEITKKAGAGFDISAIEALSQWKFKPATRNGEPVPCSIPIEVGFQMVRGDHDK